MVLRDFFQKNKISRCRWPNYCSFALGFFVVPESPTLPLTATVSPLSGLVMLVSVAGVKVTMFASPSLSASLVATRTSPPSLTSMVVTILASRTAAMPASSRSVKIKI